MPWPFLTTPTQKWLIQLLAFLNLYQHLKKMTLFHLYIFGSREQTGHTFLTMPTQTNLNQLLKFVIMYQHAKNQLMNSVYSFFRYNHFWSPFIRLAHPKIFKSSFNLCETVPACKKSVSFISSFLRYILESRHQIDHTHFCPCLTKNFSINF